MDSQSYLLGTICEDLLLKPYQLNLIILRAPHTYKKYFIPKRSGGLREIAQPAKETKYVQRWLIDNVLFDLPVSSSATAYSKGSSIKKNAELHRRHRYLLKMDFKNFFSSIRSRDLECHFLRNLSHKLSPNDIRSIIRLCCIKNEAEDELCLSVGAPTSPFLSNTIMYEFDKVVDEWCKGKRIVYTRYADDMTFSTNEKGVSSDVENYVMLVLKSLIYPNLSLNTNKTIHLSKRSQRRVTGIVINNNNELSLGRAKKREISVLVHHYITGKLDPQLLPKLQGLLGFAKDVEPQFLESMNKKYGRDNVSRLLKECR